MTVLCVASTSELSGPELAALRDCLDEAFEQDFTEQDWEHTVGGWHAITWDGSKVIAHVAVVPRTLRSAGCTLHTGYVEGMATRKAYRRQGYASVLMRAANAHIVANYEFGALSDGTDIEGFYQQLGWQGWDGPTFVDTPRGPRRTADEDGSVLVLITDRTPKLDLGGPISCDWRSGDPW